MGAELLRYGRLLGIQLRASAVSALQYRLDVVLDAALELLWAGSAVVPLLFVFRSGGAVAGWTVEEALLVVGWFTLVEAFIEVAVSPSLTTLTDHVRKGTLDFVLLKPADAQFLVATARFQLPQTVNVLAALLLFVVAFVRLGRWPSVTGVAEAALLFGCAAAIVHSFGVLIGSAAFHVVRADNLSFLFKSVFNAARWPITIFKGTLRFAFTFVVPLATMTTYPAQALLDRLPAIALVGSLGGALASLVVARAAWTRSLRRYTSAS